MPIFLSNRDTKIEERMDDVLCDHDKLINTYRQFAAINALLSRWHYLYQKEMRPFCLEEKRTYSLLDIGFGGGDLPLKIAEWAAKDDIDLEITAIENDDRAVQFAQTLKAPANVHFEKCSSTELLQRGAAFDFVISNHLLHHLDICELAQLLEEARRLSKVRVLFNDIERSDWGYLFFNILARPMFHQSFIVEDGLASLKRSYTLQELRNVVPGDWSVRRMFPFRLLLSFDKGSYTKVLL